MIHHNEILVSIPAITGRSVGYVGYLPVSTVGIYIASRTGLCNFNLHGCLALSKKWGEGGKIKFFQKCGVMPPLAPLVSTPLISIIHNCAFCIFLSRRL